MPVKPHPDFAFWAYNLSTGASSEYAALIEELSFTTIAPGGYGDLHARLKVKDARLIAQQSQFALLGGRAALMDGPFPIWQGRWDEPAVVLDGTDGDVFELTGQGAADALKDDPADTSYSGSTAQQIAIDQLTNASLGRNVTLTGAGAWLDSDTSLILPSNPGGTYFLQYDGYHVQQVLNDLLSSVGDYVWVVWGHPSYQPGGAHSDAAGFPTWCLQVLPRVPSPLAANYSAYTQDEDGTSGTAHDIRPASEYSYNAVRLKYRDASTSAPAIVTVSDSRLAANKGQGTAPFPWRAFTKDATNLTLTSTQASSLANALLTVGQNGGSKISLTLHTIRDANNSPIPLWQARANSWIYLPELAPLAQQLPTGLVQYQGTTGGNLFYITETEYRESKDQLPTLTVTCNSFSDKTAFAFARLQLQAEQKYVSKKVHATVQGSGAPEKGSVGIQFGGEALAGGVYGYTVNFKTLMSAAPSSITFTATSVSNVTSIAATDLSNWGFHFQATATANGAGFWRGTYSTVGN